jgi:hypothetical protein
MQKFAELIGPAELQWGRLNEPSRSQCVTAFRENERGFKLVLEGARRRGMSWGLVLRMIRDGDHRRSSLGAGTRAASKPSGWDEWLAKAPERFSRGDAHELVDDNWRWIDDAERERRHRLVDERYGIAA